MNIDEPQTRRLGRVGRAGSEIPEGERATGNDDDRPTLPTGEAQVGGTWRWTRRPGRRRAPAPYSGDTQGDVHFLGCLVMPQQWYRVEGGTFAIYAEATCYTPMLW